MFIKNTPESFSFCKNWTFFWLKSEKIMMVFFFWHELAHFQQLKKGIMCQSLLNPLVNQTASRGYSVLSILTFTAPTRPMLARVTPLCNCLPLFASSFLPSSAPMQQLPWALQGQVTDWLHPLPSATRQNQQAWTKALAFGFFWTTSFQCSESPFYPRINAALNPHRAGNAAGTTELSFTH